MLKYSEGYSDWLTNEGSCTDQLLKRDNRNEDEDITI